MGYRKYTWTRQDHDDGYLIGSGFVVANTGNKKWSPQPRCSRSVLSYYSRFKSPLECKEFPLVLTYLGYDKTTCADPELYTLGSQANTCSPFWTRQWPNAQRSACANPKPSPHVTTQWSDGKLSYQDYMMIVWRGTRTVGDLRIPTVTALIIFFDAPVVSYYKQCLL